MTGTSTLSATQQIVAVVVAGLLLLLVVVLVYRGRLREDYAALWLSVAILALGLSIWQDGLRAIATLFDSVTLTAPVFLLALSFLTVFALRMTVRLSDHDRRLKRLAQEIALFGVAQRQDPSRSRPDMASE